MGFLGNVCGPFPQWPVDCGISPARDVMARAADANRRLPDFAGLSIVGDSGPGNEKEATAEARVGKSAPDGAGGDLPCRRRIRRLYVRPRQQPAAAGVEEESCPICKTLLKSASSVAGGLRGLFISRS